MSDWITAGEARKILGVGSINTVKRWIREGKLDGKTGESGVMVSTESIRRLIQQGDSELAAIRRLKNALNDTSMPWRRSVTGRPGGFTVKREPASMDPDEQCPLEG